MWVTMDKVPTKKLNFIRRQHEYVLVGHPEYEELYKLLTEKGYYWIGLTSGIREVLKTCTYCQNYK